MLQTQIYLILYTFCKTFFLTDSQFGELWGNLFFLLFFLLLPLLFPLLILSLLSLLPTSPSCFFFFFVYVNIWNLSKSVPPPQLISLHGCAVSEGLGHLCLFPWSVPSFPLVLICLRIPRKLWMWHRCSYTNKWHLCVSHSKVLAGKDVLLKSPLAIILFILTWAPYHFY